MPNPPFKPLTLSQEEWRLINAVESYAANRVETVIEECEAQAQEAASLRQRLEEERAEFAVKLEQARMEPSGGYLHANAQADAHVLRIDRDSWRRVAERLENEKMQAQQQLRVITEQRDQLVPQLAQAQQERDEALVGSPLAKALPVAQIGIDLGLVAGSQTVVTQFERNEVTYRIHIDGKEVADLIRRNGLIDRMCGWPKA